MRRQLSILEFQLYQLIWILEVFFFNSNWFIICMHNSAKVLSVGCICHYFRSEDQLVTLKYIAWRSYLILAIHVFPDSLITTQTYGQHTRTCNFAKVTNIANILRAILGKVFVDHPNSLRNGSWWFIRFNSRDHSDMTTKLHELWQPNQRLKTPTKDRWANSNSLNYTERKKKDFFTFFPGFFLIAPPILVEMISSSLSVTLTFKAEGWETLEDQRVTTNQSATLITLVFDAQIVFSSFLQMFHFMKGTRLVMHFFTYI